MKKKLIIVCIIIGIIAAWKVADYYVCKPKISIVKIRNSSYASMFGDGYDCGWNDRMKNKEYSPSEAANAFYRDLGENVYGRLQQEYAAAFSTGYGYGYNDFLIGEKVNRNGYLKWEMIMQ